MQEFKAVSGPITSYLIFMCIRIYTYIYIYNILICTVCCPCTVPMATRISQALKPVFLAKCPFEPGADQRGHKYVQLARQMWSG